MSPETLRGGSDDNATNDGAKTRHTPGPWSVGKGGGCVVSEVPASDPVGGSDAVKYYGGYLVAESIAKSTAPIIAAAPDLFLALQAMRGLAVDFGAPLHCWTAAEQEKLRYADRLIAKVTGGAA